MMAPWTWCRTDGKMEFVPDYSMEIKRVDDEEAYHIRHYFIFDVFV
jgi:hypothetical protein